MRYATLLFVLAFAFMTGCGGGTPEIKPKANTQKGPGNMDTAATQKAMEESMKHMQGKMDPRMMEQMKNMKTPQQMAEEAKKKG